MPTEHTPPRVGFIFVLYLFHVINYLIKNDHNVQCANSFSCNIDKFYTLKSLQAFFTNWVHLLRVTETGLGFIVETWTVVVDVLCAAVNSLLEGAWRFLFELLLTDGLTNT